MGNWLSTHFDWLGIDFNGEMVLKGIGFLTMLKLTRWTIKTLKSNEFNPEVSFRDTEKRKKMMQICKFCQIIENGDTLQFTDDRVCAFADINSQARKHILVLGWFFQVIMEFKHTAFEFSKVFRDHEVRPAYEAFMRTQVQEDDERRKRASQMMSQLMERQQQNKAADPFQLLKEVTESMEQPDSKFKSSQQINRSNQLQYGQPCGNSSLDQEFSFIRNKDIFLQAQTKPKQTDWFSKLNQDKRDPSAGRKGLTKEEQIEIDLELIPVWKNREEELLQKQEKIQSIKADLGKLSAEQGTKPTKLVQPLVTTCFMPKRSKRDESLPGRRGTQRALNTRQQNQGSEQKLMAVVENELTQTNGGVQQVQASCITPTNVNTRAQPDTTPSIPRYSQKPSKAIPLQKSSNFCTPNSRNLSPSHFINKRQSFKSNHVKSYLDERTHDKSAQKKSALGKQVHAKYTMPTLSRGLSNSRLSTVRQLEQASRHSIKIMVYDSVDFTNKESRSLTRSADQGSDGKGTYDLSKMTSLVQESYQTIPVQERRFSQGNTSSEHNPPRRQISLQELVRFKQPGIGPISPPFHCITEKSTEQLPGLPIGNIVSGNQTNGNPGNQVINILNESSINFSRRATTQAARKILDALQHQKEKQQTMFEQHFSKLVPQSPKQSATKPRRKRELKELLFVNKNLVAVDIPQQVRVKWNKRLSSTIVEESSFASQQLNSTFAKEQDQTPLRQTLPVIFGSGLDNRKSSSKPRDKSKESTDRDQFRTLQVNSDAFTFRPLELNQLFTPGVTPKQAVAQPKTLQQSKNLHQMQQVDSRTALGQSQTCHPIDQRRQSQLRFRRKPKPNKFERKRNTHDVINEQALFSLDSRFQKKISKGNCKQVVNRSDCFQFGIYCKQVNTGKDLMLVRGSSQLDVRKTQGKLGVPLQLVNQATFVNHTGQMVVIESARSAASGRSSVRTREPLVKSRTQSRLSSNHVVKHRYDAHLNDVEPKLNEARGVVPVEGMPLTSRKLCFVIENQNQYYDVLKGLPNQKETESTRVESSYGCCTYQVY